MHDTGSNINLYVERVTIMRFGEKILLFIFRPLYRTFVERPLWWFLAKVKLFFLAEIAAQVDGIDRKVSLLKDLAAQSEASNAAQWDAIEQLLLAMFRQSDVRSSSPDREAKVTPETPVSDAAVLNRVRAASNLR